MPTLGGLAMSVGWGYRGEYGHEAGAMIPGALVALGIVLTSNRADWWSRAAVLGALGAIGWAFGGQMSYGRVIGYTAHDTFADVFYGFASLFLIGGLWGGIGMGILALGFTKSLKELSEYVIPAVLYLIVWWGLKLSGVAGELYTRYSLNDTDWGAASIAVIVALCCATLPRTRRASVLVGCLGLGWWAGFSILVLGLGLRMTPPRGDNWAGCVGIFSVVMAYHLLSKNRVGIRLAHRGFLAGGLGFAIGDFVQMLGRAQWGPIGRLTELQGLDYWKWMEQLFGLIMGIGVGLALIRTAQYVRPDNPAESDKDDLSRRWVGRLHWTSLVFLLVVIPWENFRKNLGKWLDRGDLPPTLLGVGSGWCLFVLSLSLSLVILVGFFQGRRRKNPPVVSKQPFGQTQALFLAMLWIPAIATLLRSFPDLANRGVFFVHLSFWLTAVCCSLIVVCLNDRSSEVPEQPTALASPRSRFTLYTSNLGLLLLIPCFLGLLAWLTLSTHEGTLPGSHPRFGPGWDVR